MLPGTRGAAPYKGFDAKLDFQSVTGGHGAGTLNIFGTDYSRMTTRKGLAKHFGAYHDGVVKVEVH